MCKVATPIRLLIIEGEECSKNMMTAPMLVNVLGVSEILGAASLFSEDEEQLIQGDSKAQDAIIKNRRAHLLMLTEFKAVYNYMRYITSRHRFLVARMELFGASSASTKLMSYLLENANDGELVLKRSYSSLATTLGISRATLYRAFDELEAQSKIQRNGRTIKLIDITH